MCNAIVRCSTMIGVHETGSSLHADRNQLMLYRIDARHVFTETLRRRCAYLEKNKHKNNIIKSTRTDYLILKWRCHSSLIQNVDRYLHESVIIYCPTAMAPTNKFAPRVLIGRPVGIIIVVVVLVVAIVTIYMER